MYINRELSWLEFDQRVLSEAQRSDLPLLERLKFLAITASNLDEFFQVRVGGLTAQQLSSSRSKDIAGFTAKQQLTAIRSRAQTLLKDAYSLYTDTLVPQLAEKNIHLTTDYDTLSTSQKTELTSRFNNTILPLITPLGYLEDELAPTLPSLNLITIIASIDEKEQSHITFIPIPDILDRFTILTDKHGTDTIIHIEDIIAANIHSILPEDQTITHSSQFRITRNGDIILHEEDAPENLDIAGEMEDILIQRKFSNTIRLEIPNNMPKNLLTAITTITEAQPQHIYRIPTNAPINLSDHIKLAFLPGHDKLRDPQWNPQPTPELTSIEGSEETIFETIAKKDILLYHPYQSFEPVIQLIEEAAKDPYTLVIKQVLYRTASNSRIIDALINAAENGKQVTVLVELKARFDEARNLQRADELQRAGVQIVYGVRGLKTHAKILLIVRNENGKLKRYMHLGTGNYNESTAKLYTDVSYLSARDALGADASAFFNAITGRSTLPPLKKLIPAPTQMKRTLLEKIKSETKRAKHGEKAHIIGKINSLQDKDIIDALYEASKAGVEIQLNIRGICCLKTEQPYSENIEVISVIDRYLEHARIFYFHQGGDKELYIASADWMTRNLEKRVELMIPILETSAKKRLLDILNTAFKDNTNAHKINADGTSTRIQTPKNKKKQLNTQQTLQAAAEKAMKTKSHLQSTTFEPHTPS